jgi:Tfp pilus assembly protein PilN
MKLFTVFTKAATPASPVTVAIFDDHLLVTTPTAPDHPTTVALEPRTVHRGILYKPTTLAAQLSSFLISKKLKKPCTAVHLPPDIDALSPLLPFYALQYLLALTKARIRLVSLTCTTGHQATCNLLTLFQRPNTTSPRLWLLVTFMTASTLGTGIMIKHHRLAGQYASLIQQATTLKNTNLDYEQQLKHMNQIKAHIKHLQERDVTMQKVLHKIHTPTRTLNAIAHHTPASIWLKSIVIGRTSPTAIAILAKKPKKKLQRQLLPPTPPAATKSPKHRGSHRVVIIKGTSTTAAAIARLLKNLRRRISDIRNPVLVAVNKETIGKHQGKKRGKHLLYHFVIEGVMKAG